MYSATGGRKLSIKISGKIGTPETSTSRTYSGINAYAFDIYDNLPEEEGVQGAPFGELAAVIVSQYGLLSTVRDVKVYSVAEVEFVND